jgi:hypothetical protein
LLMGGEVVGDHPKQTQRTPMHRDTTTAGGGVAGAEGPAG